MFTSGVLASILFISFVLQGIFSTLLLIATFFLALSVYSLNKVTDLEEDSVNLPDRARFVKKYRDYILFVTVESINIAVILAFFTNPSALIVILFVFCVSVFYSVEAGKLRLKNMLLFKSITIAGTITLGAVLLPLVVHANVALIVLLVAYFIFLTAFIDTVLTDVRDIEGDRKAGVRTIPVALGRNKTRNLLLLLNSTLVVWLVFSLFQAVFYPYIFVLILSVTYGYWGILRFTTASAKTKTSRLYDLLVAGKWMILALYATPFALGWLHIV
jgi:4-hydroxybenzoate polyprenyltransferase